MQTEIFDLFDTSEYEKAMAVASEKILAGGIVVFPTETVYGLGANAYDSKAVNKIFKAKGRPNDNPLIVHLSDIEDIFMVTDNITESAEKAFKAFCPGPVSIIVKRNSLIPDEVTAGLDTVAIRIPASVQARDFIRACGRPIAAPSANISGKPSPTSPSHVIRDMNGKADVILTCGNCEVGLESTVIDLSEEGHARLFRPGKITAEQIEAVTGIKVERAYTVKEGQIPSSPGMKYRHYKPSGYVISLGGDIDRIAQYINEHIRDEHKEACIVFDEFCEKIKCSNIIYLGQKGDNDTAANRLFAALRQCDLMGIETIYVTCVDNTGIGEAYMNRLSRASDEIIEL